MKWLLKSAVISNNEIAPNIFSMWIDAPEIAQDAAPGQFAELYINDESLILPRPISVCGADKQSGRVRFVYQVTGKGTRWLSRLRPGDSLKVLGPLGNGFRAEENAADAVVGGGIGLPPLLFLCKNITETFPTRKLSVFAGFRTGAILIDEFKALGLDVSVSTDDGSLGFHGNVVGLIREKQPPVERIFGCGPKIMLKSLADYAAEKGADCFVSLEERMACGVGACLGCAVKIKRADSWEYKRVCHDGPVFDAKEVIWDD